MPPPPASATDTVPVTEAGGDDLSPLAWVHDELRRTLEAAHKVLRRFLREAEAQRGSDVSALDVGALRQARSHLHQGAGALSVVGLAAAGRVIEAADAALGAAIEKPSRLDAALLEKIEQGSFAVTDYLGRLLAGKPVSSLLLFPQARALLEAAGAERVHPADLWSHAWQWRQLPADPSVPARAADAHSLAALEQLTLISMKAPGPVVYTRLSELCAGLANAAADAEGRALWQVAAGVFDAQAQGLLQPDVFSKRLASRLLSQLRAQLKAGGPDAARAAGPAVERLAHDLLFFCAQSLPPDATRPAPRLAAVRALHELQDARPVDYTHSPLGRFDPALVVQARKRVAAAKESWSAVAAGELHRIAGLSEQFSLVGDSLRRLFPDGEALAEELQQSASQSQRLASAPRAALAMEVATGLLYLEAALEESDFATAESGRPIARLAARIAAVRGGGPPEPMEAWMETLYARVSDRQTLGSVVQELRASLAAAEQQIDQFFRHPNERGALLQVPASLQAMRGVLSVLGVDQAAQALQQMRDEIEALASDMAPPDAGPQAQRFERLAGNLGALGFLIDMLGVQPALARTLFRYDAHTGTLAPVMGRAADTPPMRAAGVPVLQDVITERPPLLTATETATQRAAIRTANLPAIPVAPPEATPPADEEMRAVFIEEAMEVLHAARVALADWHAAPRELEALTRLRRAFHTLKGSARMVGLGEFGEAAWVNEQACNTRLAENTPQHDRLGHEAQAQTDAALRARTAVALEDLRRWVQHLADGGGDAAPPAPAAAPPATVPAEPADLLAPALAAAAAPGPASAPLPATASPAVPVLALAPGPLDEPLPAPAPELTLALDAALTPEAEPVLAFVSATAPEAEAQPEPEPEPQPEPEPEPEPTLEPALDLQLELEPKHLPHPQAAPTAAGLAPALDFDLTLDAGDVSTAEDGAEPAIDFELDLRPVEPAAAAAVPTPLGLPPDLPSASDLDLGLPAGPAAWSPAPAAPPSAPTADSPTEPGAVPAGADLGEEDGWVEDIGRRIDQPPVPGVDLSFLSLDLSEPRPEAPPPAAPAHASPPGIEPGTELMLEPIPAPELAPEPDTASEPEPEPSELHEVWAEELGTEADGDTSVRELDLDDDEALRSLFDELADAPVPTAPPAAEPLVEADALIDLALDAPALGSAIDAPVPPVPARPGLLNDDPAADDPAAEPLPELLHGADVTELDGLPEDVVETSPGVLESLEDLANVKQIGPLRIGIPLFNIYLNEADELSRRLCTALAEWSMERHLPLPDSALEQAHSLAGNSATVGYTALCELARALEHALARVQALGLRGIDGREDDARLFVDAADEVRRLLHQFAAGFLKLPSPELMARLAAHEADTAQRLQDSQALADGAGADAADWLAGIEVEDAVDADLFPIFEEEAQDLLPRLAASLRDWAGRPDDLAAADAAMRHLHTFKGGARLAGAMRLGELSHRLETRIERLATGGVAARGSDVEALLAGSDALQQAFEALRERDAQAYAAAEALALAAPAARALLGPDVQDVPHGQDVPHVPEVQQGPEATTSPDGSEASDAAGVPEAPGAPAGSDAPGPASTPAADAAPVPASTGSTMAPLATPPAAAVPALSPPIDWSRFDAPAPQPVAAERSSSAGQAMVRVRGALLERMVNQAGEVNLSRARMEVEIGQVRTAVTDLTDNLERLRQQLHDIELQAETQMSSRIEATKAAAQDFDPLEIDRFTRFQELTRMMAESVNDVATLQRNLKRTLERAEDELAAQSRLTRDLQADLLRTRMVEFDTLAERLHRVVRQAAKETGKQLRLDIVGGAIELDRGMLDRLTPAFEHLLRNAATHGIESPAGRQGAGKSPIGAIVLGLSQQGNEVAIELRDDGAGLDLARIRSKAQALGLPVVEGQEAELIFNPGFSTADRLTELAGRGVGLDVVRTEVMAVGGRVEVVSTAGQGSSFLLVVPLTTAVTQVLMLRCGDFTVAVPATLVERVRRVTPEELADSQTSGRHAYGDQSLPFYWLGALLQRSGGSREPPARNCPVVVVRSAQLRVALQVDEVLGHQEAVVKPLGPQLSRLPGLAGMSLLASGTVALIYNPLVLAAVYGEAAQALSRSAGAAGLHAAGEGTDPVASDGSRASAGGAALAAAPLVLVVDDSLTVRRVTQRLLVREGYRVQLAKDGMEALERIGQERPAIVLSDIEMPRMDGFELVRTLRADAALQTLPVVMISSRIAPKHREHAAALGVDHYLGKPYGEEELLALIRHHTAAATPVP